MNENLKKMILGEKMPSKDDPKYRKTYERDVEAGRNFAKRTGIDRCVGHVQKFAESHRGLFLGIVLAIVFGCLAVNASHFVRAYRLRREHVSATPAPAEQMLRNQENKQISTPIKEKEDGTDTED